MSDTPKVSQSPQLCPGLTEGRTANLSRGHLNPQKNCFLSVESDQKNVARAQVGHASSAQILFFVTREGPADLQTIPVGGAPAWKRLLVVSSALLQQ
ncbi:hypothetical protein N7478_010548 [Penicillium angulare]|uniref:uncharacterized protein n=1 Tax=Penicillium angulare TaxID=116970 RepID=UPI002541C8D8|nr:uncharacterized protein N7478_010548 [Penicillium angulare]KAJ5267740.1 hypothetical protein N7478_010548 [Penicillium angulare]